MIAELHLDAMAHGGDAVGRHQGRAVFVPGGWAGDRVQVEIIEERKRFSRARLLQVMEASPDRIEPPCPHVDDGCGGCPWQIASHRSQLHWKEDTVRSQLSHLGGVAGAEVRTIDPASPPFRYRNRMDFRVEEGRPALHRRRSRELVPLHTCLLLAPPLVPAFAALDHLDGIGRITLRAGLATGEAVAIVDGEPPADASDRWGIPTARPSRARIHEEVGGVRFRIGGRAFFQISTPGAERLVTHVEEALHDAGGRLVDGYAGVGLFAATIGRRFQQVTAVESDRRTLHDLVHNTGGRVEVVGRRFEDALGGLGRFEAAILDPPRAGLAPGVAEELTRAGLTHLAMVSCDPAAFARDARRLIEAGFEIDWVQPVDLFPQTYHVEVVARFVRRPQPPLSRSPLRASPADRI